MRLQVIAVGRIRPPYQDDLEHYRRMLAPRARLELIELRAGAEVRRRIAPRAYTVLLDPRGRALSSPELAEWLRERRAAGRDVAFVVGGPDGIELPEADLRLSFGPITLPHQLARVVLLEQLFRAHSIIAGEPYHRR